MLDIFPTIENVLEQFGSIFQIRKQLSSMSTASPVLAGIVIFVLILIVANMAITQFIEFRNKFVTRWIHSRAALTGLGACLVVAAAASVGIVLDLRKAARPAPSAVAIAINLVGSIVLVYLIGIAGAFVATLAGALVLVSIVLACSLLARLATRRLERMHAR